MHTRWPHKDRGHNRHWLSLGEILRVKNNAWAAPIAGHKYIGYALASSTLGRYYITGIGEGGGVNSRIPQLQWNKKTIWITFNNLQRAHDSFQS